MAASLLRSRSSSIISPTTRSRLLLPRAPKWTLNNNNHNNNFRLPTTPFTSGRRQIKVRPKPHLHLLSLPERNDNHLHPPPPTITFIFLKLEFSHLHPWPSKMTPMTTTTSPPPPSTDVKDLQRALCRRHLKSHPSPSPRHRPPSLPPPPLLPMLRQNPARAAINTRSFIISNPLRLTQPRHHHHYHHHPLPPQLPPPRHLHPDPPVLSDL